MPNLLRSFAAIAALLLALPLRAQDAPARRPKNEMPSNERKVGLFGGIGLGPSTLGTHCSGCSIDRINAPTAYARVGATLHQNFRVAAQGTIMAVTFGMITPVKHSFIAATVDATWYPLPRSVWYVRAGGGTWYRIRDDGTTQTRDHSPVLTLGTGLEFRITETIAVVPFVNFYKSGNVSRKVNGVPTAIANTFYDAIHGGVGLTFN